MKIHILHFPLPIVINRKSKQNKLFRTEFDNLIDIVREHQSVINCKLSPRCGIAEKLF